MKTASVRDLRNNFARVSRWLQAGEKVEITKRGVPMCLVSPLAALKNGKHLAKSEKERREMFRKRFGPEHAAWMKKVYGNKVFSDNIVITMRGEKDW